MPCITSQQMEIYRRTARRRREAEQQARALRAKQAWVVAEKAAALLKQRFQAEQVLLFGSLLRPECFDQRSDIDLAAWGIPEKDFLRAVAAVTSLDSEISVDLVRMEEASQSICRHILEEGQLL